MAAYQFQVENGALLQVPVWEESPRAKNWAAIIGVDATKPGGLSRQWLPRGRGICYYMVEQLAVFDCVEFAGDRVAWSGNLIDNRWFGVVLEKTPTSIVIEKCKDAPSAILLARQKRQERDAAAAAVNPPVPTVG